MSYIHNKVCEIFSLQMLHPNHMPVTYSFSLLSSLSARRYLSTSPIGGSRQAKLNVTFNHNASVPLLYIHVIFSTLLFAQTALPTSNFQLLTSI